MDADTHLPVMCGISGSSTGKKLQAPLIGAAICLSGIFLLLIAGTGAASIKDLRYWFPCAAFGVLGTLLQKRGALTARLNAFRAQCATVIVFAVLSFAVIAKYSAETENGWYVCGALVLLTAVACETVCHFFPKADTALITAMFFLLAAGVSMLCRLDTSIAAKQVTIAACGTLLLFASLHTVRTVRLHKISSGALMTACLAVLALAPLLARPTGGARNWLQAGSFSVQPGEFAKLLFVLASARYLTEGGRNSRRAPVCLLFVFASAGLYMAAKDMGGALIVSVAGLACLWQATGSVRWCAAGAGILGLLSALAYALFGHVRTRFAIWLNPLSAPHDSGYQIIQAQTSICSGGLFGTGLGAGSPDSIPVVQSDCIFAALCEEYGLLTGIAVIGFFAFITLRGLRIAQQAGNKENRTLAFGTAVLIGVQAALIIGGITGLLPLTGVTLPFVSAGGSSLIVSIILIGILEGVHMQGREKNSERKQFS